MSDSKHPESSGDDIHGYEWDRAVAPPATVKAAATARRGQPLGPGGTGGLRQPDPGTGRGRDGGGPGGLPDELRLTGTITAVSASSVTFRASDGTTGTYAVDGRTLIVKDGAGANLADVQSGDAAPVQVYPQGGTTMVERIFVGRIPDFGGEGGVGAVPPGLPGGTDDSGGTAGGSGATTTARSA